jgi:preprotein translocase subunit SecD
LDFWNTYRLSDRELIGVDSLKLDVHNFASHFAAKQGFVHQNSIGICKNEDSLEQVRGNLMERLADIKNLDLIWSSLQQQIGRKQYQLYMINTDGKLQAPITESFVTDSKVSQDPYSGNYNVLFYFDNEGANKWSEMTRDASLDGNRNIAMVFNNQVLMCPKIMHQISGGQCSISGEFSKNEAIDLAKKLKRKRLPFDMEILRQEFVELN